MNGTLQWLGVPISSYYDKTLEDARRLRDGSEARTAVSFDAPASLLEEAMRATGVTDPAEVALLGLAVLVGPDPVSDLMGRTRGTLGADCALDI